MGWLFNTFAGWVASGTKDAVVSAASATADASRRGWATAQYYSGVVYDKTTSMTSSAMTGVTGYVTGSRSGLTSSEARVKYFGSPNRLRLPSKADVEEQEFLETLKDKVAKVQMTLLAQQQRLQTSFLYCLRKSKAKRKEVKLAILQELQDVNHLNQMANIVSRGLQNEEVIKGVHSRTKALLITLRDDISTYRKTRHASSSKP